MSIEEEIQSVEEEIRKTPYNKATQHHIGKLKAKLARLREKKDSQPSGKGGSGFSVKKKGDATVILVGFPSVGKSTLINKLTNTKSEVAAYNFTTLTPIPGMMEYNGADIQIIDIPGIIEGAAKGKGMGREILAQARVADLILIVLDSKKLEQEKIIREELRNVGIRLNRRRPDIKIKGKDKGGIEIARSVKDGITNETVKGILSEFGYHNAYVLIREKVDEDGFIEAISKNIVYIPSLTVINKVDKFDPDYKKECVKISAEEGLNLEELMKKMWEKLGLVRVYLKKQGKEPDMEEPLILEDGVVVEDIAKKIIKNYKERWRYAKLWGKNAKFPGQRIGLNYNVKDEDIISIITTT